MIKQRLKPRPSAGLAHASNPEVAGAGQRLPGQQNANVLAALSALKTASVADLKIQWRALFETEPPPYNRRFLESRLAYRIQELTYGGLKPQTVARLEALAERIDGRSPAARNLSLNNRPIAGTKLIRDYQGVEHAVTVTSTGFEWEGRPYKSLSAIARRITGTRWNGWIFFGLKSMRGKA